MKVKILVASFAAATAALSTAPLVTAQAPTPISFTTWHMQDDFNNISSWFIVAADQDKDGDVDFMGLANSGSGNALMFMQSLAADENNIGNPPRLVVSAQGFNRQHVRFWDGNGDGYAGYVATDRGVGLVYRDRTSGGLDAAGEQQVQVQWCATCNGFGGPRFGELSYLDVGDIDGDGTTDVVAIGDRFNPNIRVFYNHAGTLVPGAVIAYPGGDWDGSGVRLADFDGDGRLDIVFTKLIDPNSPAAAYNVYRNNGDGTFTGVKLPKNLSALSLAVGDVNGDGKPDVFVSAFGEDDGHGNTIAGTGGIYLFTNTSSGGNITFSASKVFGTDASHWVPSVDAGDLNGDGFADIVFSVSNGDSSDPHQNPQAWAGDGTGNFTLAWTDTGANVVADTVTIIKYNGHPAIATGGYRGAYLFANFAVANPPVVTVPADMTVEATSASGATVTFTASASDGTASVPVNCTPASGSTFGITTTSVTCSATTAGGNDSKSFNVTVQDTTPPTIIGTPGNTSTEATSSSGATVSYTLPTATDVVDGTDAVTCTPSAGTFALGTTTVNCSAHDAHQNQAVSTSFTVTVKDTTPPVITSVSPSQGSLWPPNKAMVPVSVSVSDTDAVSSPSCKIVSVSSNEPGAGQSQITGPLTVNLQSDRLGTGNGRIYTIAVACTDAAGNTSSTKTTTVVVPHDQGKK